MKRKLSILLATMLILSVALQIFVSASADTTPTVYLSDNGDDENSGQSETAPVKTFERAQEVLGDAGGVILIPDVYTYPATGAYYMAYKKGASYVFRGTRADGSSRFVHGRGNIAMNNPLTFDNLTYTLTKANCTLIAHWNKLVMTETVTMKPYNDDATNRSNFPVICGGEWGKSGQIGQNTDLVLNGGTFNYIVLGCLNGGEMYGDVTVNIGGNAKILNRVYCGGSGLSDVYGDISVLVSGGEIADLIYAGGINSEETTSAYVSGNVSIKVTGGMIKGICCLGSYEGPVDGNILIDLTAYVPATAEWAATRISKQTKKTVVYLYGETIPDPTEPDPNDSFDSTPVSDQPTPTTDQSTPATNDTPTTTTTPATTNESKPAKKKGCGSVLGSGVLIVAATLGMGGFLARKKREV